MQKYFYFSHPTFHNIVPNVQVSDTTGDATTTTAGVKIFYKNVINKILTG
ncbi:hypothetical protein [Panacibacter ginsenosidivorans]|nr:hypothetical protein [Panacibacter ginsenosidivorans]